MKQEEEEIELPQLFHQSSLRQPKSHSLEVRAVETVDIRTQSGVGVNQYVYTRLLGKGAFAKVYQATNGVLRVAVKENNVSALRKQKMYTPSGQFADHYELLKNQVDIVKRLQHPYISCVHQVLYSPNQIFIVSDLGDLGALSEPNCAEFPRNPRLMELLSKRYSLNSVEECAKFVLLKLCEAVGYLHRNHITHRDIKPQNIVCSSVEGREIMLTDFSTVRYSESDISYNPAGTPGFSAPEVFLDGYSCKKADVWSLGVTLFVFYTEHFPYWANSDYEVQKLSCVPLPTHTCPASLAAVIEAMTHFDPISRCTLDQAILKLQG